MKSKKQIIKPINGNDINIWKVNTQGLLQEVLNNPGTAALSIPLNIFGKILAQVAERAIQINDKELNKLMIRLALYENCLPSDPGFKEIEEYLKS